MAIAFRSAANDTDDPNAAGGDIILAAPSGVTSGDLRLHWLFAFGGSGAPDIGTGMSSACTGGSGPNLRASYKIAGGSEGSITHTTPGADTISFGYCALLTGIDGTTPVDTTASTAGVTASSSGSTTLPTVTTAVANCRLVYFISCGSGQLPTMGATTLHGTGVDLGGGDAFAVYYEDQAGAGGSTARTVSYTGSDVVAYGIVVVQPTAGPPEAIPGLWPSKRRRI